MRRKGSRFTLGGVWGLRLCSPDVAQPFATVRVRAIWPCLWRVLQGWSLLDQTSRSLVSFGRRGTAFQHVSERVKHRFVWQAQYFCIVFRRRVAFSWQAQHLETSIVILRGSRSTLDVCCCIFFTNRIVRAGSSGDNVQIAWQAWHVVTCDETPHSTLHTFYTLHFALFTSHSTHHTLHSTLYTLHSTLYTLRFELYTPHFTLYTLHSTLYTLHSTLYKPGCWFVTFSIDWE